MKLYHHDTCNRSCLHTCGESVQIQIYPYVPCPCVLCTYLYHGVTVDCTSWSGHELHCAARGKWLKHSSTPTERLAWQAITNCRRYNDAPGNARAMSELNKSTLFFGVRTADIFKSGAYISLSSINCCGLFQINAWLSMTKNMGASDPSEVTQETT